MVAGRGILRNYGRNNNSPATGGSINSNDIFLKTKLFS
jgi:hypothetical protein